MKYALIEFVDHCENGDLLKCQLIGEIIKETGFKYHVKVWILPEEENPETLASNETFFTLIKNAVISVTPLRPMKVKWINKKLLGGLEDDE